MVASPGPEQRRLVVTEYPTVWRSISAEKYRIMEGKMGMLLKLGTNSDAVRVVDFMPTN